MFDDNIEQCFKQIAALVPKNSSNVSQIICKYCPITTQQLPPLPQVQYFNNSLIQDKYIPSPDLLASYNTNFSKTLSLNMQSKVGNTKLKQLYGDTKVNRNNIDFAKMRQTVPDNPFLKPSVLVEEREETILQDLRDKKIEATIPQMQSSLRVYEISSLERKDIKIENAKEDKKEKGSKQGLSQWKKMRQKFTKNLSK